MSSRIEEQWQDTGSGYGHVQRVRVYEPNPLQVAYSVYIAHTAECPDCVEERCPTAEPLWRKYYEERQAAAERSGAVERR